LFVYEISREPLYGFAPNSQGKRVLVPRSDEFEGARSKVKRQGQKTAFFGIFGGLRAVDVW